jgi:hypothetical protein
MGAKCASSARNPCVSGKKCALGKGRRGEKPGKERAIRAGESEKKPHAAWGTDRMRCITAERESNARSSWVSES